MVRVKSGSVPGVNTPLPLLFYADGYKFPDVYHLTRFLAPDPIIALEQDGEVVIVANSLEEGRARKESRAREVFNIDDFGAKAFSKTATVFCRPVACDAVPLGPISRSAWPSGCVARASSS